MPHFKGPAEFAVYGGPKGGAVLRVSGYTKLEDAKEGIARRAKAYPDWEYSLWRANWTKLEENLK